MSDECILGHSWEVYSGDIMNCIECGAVGEVEVTYEPEDEEPEEEVSEDE
jgi:hypothetical protein